ncbi:MAG: molybdopterin-synthase adenylyltransferase MoeB [Gemmatimonadetes bacterium]|nr:molybdopterin-synthase adenylyltransferase MoeB [Gemmatimonadota bacterium]
MARYARHLVLPEVGVEGQERLKQARVLVVGAGGLGSPVTLYLAAAGVGTLGLVDFDEVDITNLQRQILHGTSDVGRAKLDSARDRLSDINPHVEVVLHATRLTSDNALEIIEPYDIVVDGTDNFPTRYLVNDACVLLGKPNVYGSVFRWEGQVSVFGVHGGPCYRCLFREPPPPGLVPNCAEGGVLGVLPGVVGSLQALETVKLILEKGESLAGRLLIFDALDLNWREMALSRNPECPICGDAPTQTGLIDYEEFCGLHSGDAPGATETDMAPDEISEIDPSELAERLATAEPPFLLDVREPYEWSIANLEDGGAVLIPLGEVQDRLDEIPTDREVVVYCRSGQRSAAAVRTLLAAGLPRVHNLRGGVLAWADDIDPSLTKY